MGRERVARFVESPGLRAGPLPTPGARNPNRRRIGRAFATFRSPALSVPLGTRTGSLHGFSGWATGRTRKIRGGDWGNFGPRASSAVLRTAGLARWAFGPPPERTARTRRNWAENWAVLLRFRRNRRACGGASSMPGPDAAARTGWIEAACWLVGWTEFLRFGEQRGPDASPSGRDAQRLLLAASTQVMSHIHI